MATHAEHIAALDQLVAVLNESAITNARALAAHRGSPAEQDVERQLEDTLDRIALLYGRGTYENLSTESIFQAAIEAELRLAHEHRTAAPAVSAASASRATALVDAARRGVRLSVRGAASVPLYRGAYVTPLQPKLQQWLQQQHLPFVRWRQGALIVLPEETLDELRAGRVEVDVLFLDPDELLDLDGRPDRTVLETELDQRLTRARHAPDHVGDSHERHLRRSLLQQSIVLRNLRDRLATEHPAAHRALLPILAAHRTLLEASLTAASVPSATEADPLAASILQERALQALVTRWAAEPDEAGLQIRFKAVAGSASHLTALERHRP